jgi:H+/Cl- antiporter ClcA
MKKLFQEQPYIFVSVLKWVSLATIVGILVGLATTLFLTLLKISIFYTAHFHYYFIALPVILFITAAITVYLAPDAEGHGTEKVIEAIHKRAGKINAVVVPIKLVTTILTIAFGGSGGKEGPCAQIGAGISSVFAGLLRFNDAERRKLVICGVSAGFAAVFGTPIAGAIFGVEVLFVGTILYDVLLPSFIAGIISYHVSTIFGVTYFYNPINVIPVFSNAFFIKVLLAGLVFGIISVVFVEILNLSERASHRLKIWKPLKGIIGGAVLVIVTLLLSSDRFLGLGLTQIEAVLQGVHASWYDSFMKMAYTSVTLSFGGSGGIVTPIFFVGSTAGSTFASIMHLDPATFAAIGMVAVLAGCANTPIAASIMSVELFGPQIAPYATIACVISFLISGNSTVYSSQKISMNTSTNVKADLVREIKIYDSKVRPLFQAIYAFALKLFKKDRKP